MITLPAATTIGFAIKLPGIICYLFPYVSGQTYMVPFFLSFARYWICFGNSYIIYYYGLTTYFHHMDVRWKAVVHRHSTDLERM